VSPMLRSRLIATLDKAVVRVSMVIRVDTRSVFAAISSLDKTANFPKKTFGGVEIMKVPLDAQYGGRRLLESVRGSSFREIQLDCDSHDNNTRERQEVGCTSAKH
jgi:hypothetical protein